MNIEQMREQLRQAELEQEKANLTTFKKIKGKIYRPSTTELWRVEEIAHAYSATKCSTFVTRIKIYETNIVIDTNYLVELDIYDTPETDGNAFKAKMLKAMDLLTGMVK